ncbi:hypothetical protein SE17_14275 [Kouleothrix aurantiaca]|uniref:Uncharacterized protein n=1 Tax=Kouleothrix aurantiaca TaxID=186479 RepID=A0A0P9FHP1_9CHLR|nr:hypothetical protein SE17_14275 [Kouleothrix aurantiaca]
MSRYPTDPNLQFLRGSRGGKVRRGYLAHYAFAPAAVANGSVLAATTLLDAVVQNLTQGFAHPDVPRCLSIKGNAAGIAGNVVITGVDANGFPLTETIALNGTTVVAGTLAFAKITKITLPVRTAAGNTVQVGVTNKLGLWHSLTWDSRLVTQFDGAADAGTLAIDDDEVTKNLFTPAGTLDGTKILRIVYVV